MKSKVTQFKTAVFFTDYKRDLASWYTRNIFSLEEQGLSQQAPFSTQGRAGGNVLPVNKCMIIEGSYEPTCE